MLNETLVIQELPFTNLINLEEAEELPSEMKAYLTNLKKMAIYYPTKGLELQKFSKLESLTIHSDVGIEALCILPHTKDITQLSFGPIYNTTRKLRQGEALFGLEEVPARFPRLKSLTHREVNSNSEPFNVPAFHSLECLNVSAEHIGNLSAVHETLTSLTLKCQILDCEPLATLTKLRSICIEIRSNGQGMHFLTALTNLENIKFRPYGMGSWEEVAGYITSEKLTSLNFPNGKQHFDSLAKFSNLKELGFGQILPPGPSIGKFPYLTKLRFNHATAKDVPFIESLTTLKKLQFVGLLFGGLNTFPIEHMTALEHFKFNGGESQDSKIELSVLQPLKLKSLYISWQTDQFAENVSHITTLEKVYLRNASLLTDDSISLLATLTNLTSLTLHKVNEEKLTGVTLTLLTSLQVLEMQGGFEPLQFDSVTLIKKMPRLYAAEFI